MLLNRSMCITGGWYDVANVKRPKPGKDTFKEIQQAKHMCAVNLFLCACATMHTKQRHEAIEAAAQSDIMTNEGQDQSLN